MHPAEITYRIPYTDHMTVYPDAVGSVVYPGGIIPVADTMGGACTSIWANCPNWVWSAPDNGGPFYSVGQWMHDGMNLNDDKGLNPMVTTPWSFYNNCIVLKADISVTFTPTATHNPDDNAWAWNSEATCFLAFSSNWNHFNTGGDTAASIASPYQIKTGKYVKLGCTRLSPGSNPSSCVLKGSYQPHKLYHFKDLSDEPNFDVGCNNPLDTVQPSVPPMAAFWTLGMISANPVPAASEGATVVQGVPFVHRVDVKVVYTVKFVNPKSNPRATYFCCSTYAYRA